MYTLNQKLHILVKFLMQFWQSGPILRSLRPVRPWITINFCKPRYLELQKFIALQKTFITGWPGVKWIKNIIVIVYTLQWRNLGPRRPRTVLEGAKSLKNVGHFRKNLTKVLAKTRDCAKIPHLCYRGIRSYYITSAVTLHWNK